MLPLADGVLERPVEWAVCVCRERAWAGGVAAESPDRETAYAAAAPASASATRMAPAPHRRAVAVGAQPPAHLEAAHVRHADVEDDRIRRRGGDPVEGGTAVSGGGNLVALLHQGPVERVDHRRLVIDYQDFHRQSIGRHPKTDVNSLQAGNSRVSS